jgi:TPR repeat protein
VKRAGLVLALAIAAIPGRAGAFELCDDPSKREAFYAKVRPWEATFAAKRYDELDKHFNGLLKALDGGTESDAMVQRAFSLFQSLKPGNEPLHVEWVRKFPKSRAAHLAMAYYYENLGWGARGDEFAGKTSREQFAAMEAYFRQAITELDAADALGKTTLTAAKRIGMARAGSALRLDATQLYRDAIKADPRTLEVRIRYINASVPKWGGSMRQLASIVDDAKTLPPSDRRYIEYLVYQEMANTYSCDSNLTPECGQFAKAAEYYEKSIPLCPGLDNALRNAVGHYARQKDDPNVMRTATLLIERSPRNGWARAMRGRSYIRQQKYKEAFDDYRAGADLGSGEAFEGLAWLYATGQGTPQDNRKAIDLYTSAANLGVKGAREKADLIRAGSGLK